MLSKPQLLSIICLFSVPIVQGQREQACDLNCRFEKAYISSEKLKKWPKTCKIVCGNLIFNEKTDLTDYELTVNFWKLEVLKGFLRFQNSSLTSLSFLENLRARQCEGGEFGEFVVSNNPYLTNLGKLQNFANGDTCTWRIVKNPQLDISSYEFLAYRRLENYGNLKDYECVNVRITSESLPYYSNCTSINNGAEEKALKISNMSSSMDLTGFLKLKSVAGGIEISNTDLVDLSFLKNLKIIDMPGGPTDRATIEIQNNPNLKRLGWDSITALPTNGKLLLNITKNHPEFCLTIEEVQKFAKVAPRDGQKVCKFNGFGSFETDCRHVVGDVVIDEDNEKDVWMLENVTYIYGSLIVRDTRELANLDFLSSLRLVMRLTKDEDQIIRVLSNKKLEQVIFPKMKTPPFPIGEGDFIDIDGNSLEIFKVQRECILIRAMTRADVKYNGKGCSKLPRLEKTTKHSTFKFSNVWIFIILLFHVS
ncbi:Protein CBG01177 [Caenorhabditis briggsae]|uniref:Protein CBG01177 n=1 Tax=Caenorhabditis briggsae TaxID=6238 RepID=A8WPR8_CAEBR|nr:Protein CBG01177 [Caenorhabditis briggsae]CAP22475.1 Protein CBG01177 [Caenorhabditis briggsae]